MAHKKKVVNAQTVNAENRSMSFQYSVISEPALHNKVFGICIDKYEYRQGEAILIESEATGAISSSLEFVISMARRLSKAIVTPCTLLEIVDELITQSEESDYMPLDEMAYA